MAIVAALEVALRAGQAPTQHGVRPHVAVVVPAQAIGDGHGAVDTTWTGPLPYAEVAALMGDSSLTRLVADATGVPVSVTRRVRTVPAGLWQIVSVRDRGCIAVGCDAQPGWCQVAHLGTPYRDDGKLTPDTAGLLCTAGVNHHAIFDRGGGTVTWEDGRPVVHLTSSRPAYGAGRAVTDGAELARTDPGVDQPRLVHERPAAYRLDVPPLPTGPPRRGAVGPGRRRSGAAPVLPSPVR